MSKVPSLARTKHDPDEARRRSRRRFFQTAGVGITLPMLPSLMWERRAQAQASSCEIPQRFVAYMFGNGTHKADFIPPGGNVSTALNVSGDAWQLPTPLQSMQALKEDIVFVSGLENQERRRQPGDHGIGCGSLLTARMPTANQTITNMSVDQAIADKIHDCYTGIHSLQLGTHSVGYHDSWGTFYTQNISWRGAVENNADGSVNFPVGNATPLGKVNDPRQVFERMFAGYDPDTTDSEAEMRRALRKSVLDTIVPHGDSLRNQLNAEDRAKLEELFTGIRALEQEIDSVPSASCEVPPMPPTGLTNNDAFRDQLNTMHDLMVVALQCDITRVITFMQTDPISDRNFSFIPGVNGAGGVTSDHAGSHHTGDPAMIEQYKAMVIWKMEQIASFLTKVKAATDLNGEPLLSNSLIWIGSEIADGDYHDHQDIRILTAGQLGGLVTTNRHVRFPPGGWNNYNGVKTFGDFYLTLVDLYGVQATSFGNDGVEAITWQR
jgi:hypothetical protein